MQNATCWRGCGVLLALVGIALAPTSWAVAGETVRVSVASGRVFLAQIDPTSNAERLCLRFGTAQATVWRSVAWPRVVEVRTRDKTFSGAEFQQALARHEWPADDDLFPDAPESLPVPALTMPATAERDAQASFDSSAMQLGDGLVRTLHIEAYLGNWDSDVEVDGILLHVFPLDDYGQILPIDGVIEVNLIGERQYIRSITDPFPQLGRWTQQVSAEQVGPRGAVFQLPFQAIHPEFDLDVNSFGLVHARLIVPGAGTFDDSAGMVRIRPYSEVRDRNQQIGGVRFFPQETTGRSVISGRPTP